MRRKREAKRKKDERKTGHIEIDRQKEKETQIGNKVIKEKS